MDHFLFLPYTTGGHLKGCGEDIYVVSRVHTPSVPMTSHGVQKKKEVVHIFVDDLVNEMIA